MKTLSTRCLLLSVPLILTTPMVADESLAIHEIIERTVREIEEMNRQIDAARREAARAEAAQPAETERRQRVTDDADSRKSGDSEQKAETDSRQNAHEETGAVPPPARRSHSAASRKR